VAQLVEALRYKPERSFLLFQILEATGSNPGREIRYSDRRSSCFSSVFPVK
jgi:hypothetical protein